MDFKLGNPPKVFGTGGKKAKAISEDLELSASMYGNRDDDEEKKPVAFVPAQSAFQTGDSLKVVGSSPEGIVIANEKGLRETLPTQQTVRRLEFKISQLENNFRRTLATIQKLHSRLIEAERAEEESWRKAG